MGNKKGTGTNEAMLIPPKKPIMQNKNDFAGPIGSEKINALVFVDYHNFTRSAKNVCLCEESPQARDEAIRRSRPER